MKNVFFAFLAFFVGIQLIRPDFTNPPVDAQKTINADANVMKVLKTSCFDCHSNETVYPWYQHIAPVSWIMSDHIKRGRTALNFSEWTQIDSKVKLLRLERAKQVLSNDMMPKHEYLWMHRNAVLSAEDKQTLTDYFDGQIKMLDDSNATMRSFSHDYSTM